MNDKVKVFAERARSMAYQVSDMASAAAAVAGEKAKTTSGVVSSRVGETINEENLRQLSASTKTAALDIGGRASELSKKIVESDTVKNSKKYLSRARNAAVTVGEKHAEIADHADTAAKAANVAAGVAVVGAAAAAPTGLTAIGVSLGIISAPAIVTAAPILVGAAGAAFTVSAGASLYSKYKSRDESGDSDEVNSETSTTFDSNGLGGSES